MLRLALLSLLALLLLAPAAQAADVKVYFTKGEQLASVDRDVTPGAAVVSDTMKQLLAGPTPAEARSGFGSAIPSGAKLVSARIDAAQRRAYLEFDARFASPKADLYRAELAEVVYTVSALTGLDSVNVKAPGHAAQSLTRSSYDRTTYTPPTPATPKVPAPSDPRAVQTRLVALTYLPADAVTGTYDYRTQQAVLAFQAWEGLGRDGVVGPQTSARLASAQTPIPLSRGPGHHIEIYRQRGVVLLIDGQTVVRAIHTSTGVGGDDPDLGTPPGTWKVYRKEIRSWSVPYKTWLPYATYWNAGWALHGYADVPARPASHGCARLPMPEAKIVYDFAPIGTPVRVI